jgi:TetR/AcrR family transcriptional regulator
MLTKRAAAGARQKPAPAVPLPTREAILDAAELLFAERGVDGVAVRDLARELKLTPSSLYNHFPSKQALYEAVLERGLQPFAELFSDPDPGPITLDAVRRTVALIVDHLAAHPHLARLVQRALIEETDSVQELIQQALRPLYEKGLAVVRNVADDAEWNEREVPHLAIGLFAIVFAFFVNVPALRRMKGRRGEGYPVTALENQKRFLEKAIYRLVGARQHPKAAAGTSR